MPLRLRSPNPICSREVLACWPTLEAWVAEVDALLPCVHNRLVRSREALHRLYGDKYERNGGNNTPATATDLGRIQGCKSLGTDAATLLLGSTATEFLSVDGTNDVDCFHFSSGQPSALSVRVVPHGPDYDYCAEGDQRVKFNASRQSDLRFRLLNAKGSVLQQVNHTGIGQAENPGTPVPAGDYYLRLSGTEDRARMYRLDLSVSPSGAR